MKDPCGVRWRLGWSCEQAAVYGSRHTRSRKNSVLTRGEKMFWSRNFVETLRVPLAAERGYPKIEPLYSREGCNFPLHARRRVNNLRSRTWSFFVLASATGLQGSLERSRDHVCTRLQRRYGVFCNRDDCDRLPRCLAHVFDAVIVAILRMERTHDTREDSSSH